MDAQNGSRNRRLIALSADPITNEDIDFVRWGAAKCSGLVVAVVHDVAALDSWFGPPERLEMTKRALVEAGLSDVSVVASERPLLDVCVREGCSELYSRDGSVILAERLAESPALAVAEDRAARRTESSALIREMAVRQMDISRTVPVFVKRLVEERHFRRRLIGLTGGIAVGKSHLATRLTDLLPVPGRQVSHISVDGLIRELYAEASPGAQDVRDRLAAWFGPTVLNADRSQVERSRLADLMFAENAPVSPAEVAALTRRHVERKFREALGNRTGVVLVEWAQLAEMDMGRWTNNDVIVVDSPDRDRFAAARGLSAKCLLEVDRHQWPVERKMDTLIARAVADRHGRVLRYENRFRSTPEEIAAAGQELAAKVVSAFGLC